MIQEQLRQIGLKADVVALETRSVIGQWSAGDYDAIYFASSSMRSIRPATLISG
jgi:ABC-type transport system substrate-binding protein